MKCGYPYCKLNGNVDKKEATKIGSRYFHKECAEKKEVKSRLSKTLIEFGFMQKNVNIALKSLIDTKGVDVKFLEFTVNYIVKNKLDLNSPYGIGYYLENYKIIKGYKDNLRLEKIQQNRESELQIERIEDTTFEYNKKTPKYLKIL